jgi:hypothetical protein
VRGSKEIKKKELIRGIVVNKFIAAFLALDPPQGGDDEIIII